MLNDTQRPLLLLGSNSNIYKILELAESVGVAVAGILDNDYEGAGVYKGIPVLGGEQHIQQFAKTHQFICATNWTPDPPAERNRQKRARQLELLEGLELATLVSPLANVSRFSTIGAGTAVFAYASVEPEVTVGEHSLLYDYSIVGHESRIGHNVVLQRHVLITSLVTVEDHVYFGLCSKACRSYTTIGSGTFVHPHIMLLRGTERGETVSLASRKTYGEVVVP